jgi:hypothetical protein
LVLEYKLGAEIEAEPVFEISDQKHRCCGIQTQTSKFRLRVDALRRQLQSPGKIRDTPIADLGFGRICFHGGNPLPAESRVDEIAMTKCGMARHAQPSRSLLFTMQFFAYDCKDAAYPEATTGRQSSMAIVIAAAKMTASIHIC